MGRDNYKGIPKKLQLVMNRHNELEAPYVRHSNTKLIHGVATLSGISPGRAQYILSDSRIGLTSVSFAYPTNHALINLSCSTGVGKVTVSGNATGSISYQIYIHPPIVGVGTFLSAGCDSVDVSLPTDELAWSSRGIPVPNSWWLFNGTAGNVDDLQTAGTDRDAIPTAGVEFEQPVECWPGSIRLTQEEDEHVLLAEAGTYNSATTSIALLVYARINATALGIFLSLGADSEFGPLYIYFSGTGAVLVCNGNTGAGSYVYEDDGQVHPFLLVYDRTNGRCRLYTDKEVISAVYTAAVTDGAKTIGIDSVSGSTVPTDCNVFFAALWHGASAEELSESTLTALGW